MKQIRCEREREVAASLRTGLWTPELGSHLHSCTICAETAAISKFLLAHADALKQATGPAPAGLVWRRAQMQKQEIALKRALRPLLFMRALGFACAAFVAIWLLHSSWSFSDAGFAFHLSPIPIREMLAGTGITLFLIAAGAWFLRDSGKQANSTATFT
ncbi:MAG TPA: hypothetical protein VFE38_00285 [Edaphobacter sp.]|nr:hypothetical protein [Edaphobacter sp.]